MKKGVKNRPQFGTQNLSKKYAKKKPKKDLKITAFIAAKDSERG